MKLVDRFFKFCINSNIHVSVAGMSFVLVSMYYYKIGAGFNSSVFVFFSTLFSYNFIRIFEGAKSYYDLKTLFNRQPGYMPWLLIISLAGLLYLALLIPVLELIILIPAGFLTFAYVFPIVKYRKQWVSLRDYPGLKLLSIAMAWAIVTLLFPLQDYLDKPDVWILFVQRIFLIMALVIPFDIRDLQYDASYLNTLPQRVGITKSIVIGVLFLLVFLFGSFLQTSLGQNHLPADLFVFMISLGFLIKSKPNQSKYYASFWVESVPIFWLLFILFVENRIN